MFWVLYQTKALALPSFLCVHEATPNIMVTALNPIYIADWEEDESPACLVPNFNSSSTIISAPSVGAPEPNSVLGGQLQSDAPDLVKIFTGGDVPGVVEASSKASSCRNLDGKILQNSSGNNLENSVHFDGDKLVTELKKAQRKKEKRKKHRPKVVEIEKPEKKPPMETPKPPETPQQKPPARKKSKMIGRRKFAGKKKAPRCLDNGDEWGEAGDQVNQASGEVQSVPSSKVQISGDEAAAIPDADPQLTNSSFGINISIDELLQELAKLPVKPFMPLLLKEDLLMLNMYSSVDVLNYIVDNISIPCLLNYVFKKRRRKVQKKGEIKLRASNDHSGNKVLEDLVLVLQKFLPSFNLNYGMLKSAGRERKNVASRRTKARETIKGNYISTIANNNFQLVSYPYWRSVDTTVAGKGYRSQLRDDLKTTFAAKTVTMKGQVARNLDQFDLTANECSSNFTELVLEHVIQTFRLMDINKDKVDCPAQVQNALVPFLGDGMIVPFSGSNAIVPYEQSLDRIKQRSWRGEVQLDSETIRVWKLLQANGCEDGIDGMVPDMVKWWENERQVFYGRAKSFIARMNLILGDRQFSPWKGSIVDSVVGVFLTQNVSDHLSSSAFMSLAARFPLPTRGDKDRVSESKLLEQDGVFNDATASSLGKIHCQESIEISRDMLVEEKDLANVTCHCQNSTSSFGMEKSENIMEIDVDGYVVKDAPNILKSSFVNAHSERIDASSTLHESTTFSNSNSGHHNMFDVGQEAASNYSNGNKISFEEEKNTCKAKKAKVDVEEEIDWEGIRRRVYQNGSTKERSCDTMDSVDWEAVRKADTTVISDAIRERGMNIMLAQRIKDFLDRLVRDHGSIDLEWLRNISPDEAKKYLLSIRGLGLKSVECIRLLAIQNVAFPVDVNVARVGVRLGWVPLKPLPDSLQLHLLEQYELHYHMITFGKVFCTKSRPNCKVCPMRGECKHFNSAKLALPAPEDKNSEPSSSFDAPVSKCGPVHQTPLLPYATMELSAEELFHDNCFPIITEPPSPPNEPVLETDIEDAFIEDLDEIPTIKLDIGKFAENLQNIMSENVMEISDNEMSKALVKLTAEAASVPVPDMCGFISPFRYELPNSHPLLKEMDLRESDDPSPYLLAIWFPGETAQSTEQPQSCCKSQELGQLCRMETCFACNNVRELNAQTVRGTLLVTKTLA
ncbi:Transcriptional activator DEMETER [Apostasia shenzhenica]|uniref:Transcriptional activator DEMETER n=1 Tax=Apostasia shenzhenica TaxID=1088818 RepID=A0A2I0AIK7_9ASPA|nr:Transcriptional activator DEMETER [Apostasia shenzhenica]